SAFAIARDCAFSISLEDPLSAFAIFRTFWVSHRLRFQNISLTCAAEGWCAQRRNRIGLSIRCPNAGQPNWSEIYNVYKTASKLMQPSNAIWKSFPNLQRTVVSRAAYSGAV